MSTNIAIRSRLAWTIACTLCVALPVRADQAASLDAPASVGAGSSVPVKWTGPNARFDKIGIVAAGAPENAAPLTDEYLIEGRPTNVTAPEQPGEYELRYLAHGGATLARRKLSVVAVTATLAGPYTAVGGAAVPVIWTGPDNRFDKIGIVAAGAPERESPLTSEYLPATKGPARVRAPEKPGEYELRYLTSKGATLARAKLTVTGATATISAPASVVGGASVAVTWKGPSNRFDQIGIVAAGAPEKQSPLTSTYLPAKGAARVVAPEPPGEYEIRYLTGDSDSTLARAKLTVTKAAASIQGPVSAVAGTTFKVIWQGPANPYDHIVVAPKGSGDDAWATSNYVTKGKALSLRAPLTVGEYELRYLTGSRTARWRARCCESCRASRSPVCFGSRPARRVRRWAQARSRSCSTRRAACCSASARSDESTSRLRR